MRIFPKKNQTNRRFYLINYQVPNINLRVIDAQGKQIGILSKEEALKIAQENEMDLVLIAPSAQPPVAKIIDFKKFLYREEKKNKEAKKGIKKSSTKDVNLNLFIAEADFNRLVNRINEFLTEGNQVRINLILRGREIAKTKMGFDLINKLLSMLGEINFAKPPQLDGRVIRTVIAKKK